MTRVNGEASAHLASHQLLTTRQFGSIRRNAAPMGRCHKIEQARYRVLLPRCGQKDHLSRKVDRGNLIDPQTNTCLVSFILWSLEPKSVHDSHQGGHQYERPKRNEATQPWRAAPPPPWRSALSVQFSPPAPGRAGDRHVVLGRRRRHPGSPVRPSMPATHPARLRFRPGGPPVHRDLARRRPRPCSHVATRTPGARADAIPLCPPEPAAAATARPPVTTPCGRWGRAPVIPPSPIDTRS
jgi:hypothetical protein